MSALFEDGYVDLRKLQLSRALYTKEQLAAHHVLTPFENMHVRGMRAFRLHVKLADLKLHRARESLKLRILHRAFAWMKTRTTRRRRARYMLTFWQLKLRRKF